MTSNFLALIVTSFYNLGDSLTACILATKDLEFDAPLIANFQQYSMLNFLFDTIPEIDENGICLTYRFTQG